MAQIPDPGSRLEEEGIPDLQDGTPEQQWANDPQEMPILGDEPVAVEEYGTTLDEQLAGEPLDMRLAREEPDGNIRTDDQHAGRLVEPDEGAREDTEKDMVASEFGADGGGFSAEERAISVQPE